MKQMQGYSRFVMLLILILAFSAGNGWGTPRAHDRGLFLRLSGGGGYAKTKVEEGSDSFRLSGMSIDVNIAIGAIVTPNLAVHATIPGWVTLNPEAYDCYYEECRTHSISNIFSLRGIGGGITYYSMPTNIYTSGSICAAKVSLEAHDDACMDSDLGLVIDTTVGKEWWISDNWGLGVAGAFGYHSVSVPKFSEKWSGPSFAIRFSATYD